jgi:hypothetical protein
MYLVIDGSRSSKGTSCKLAPAAGFSHWIKFFTKLNTKP